MSNVCIQLETAVSSAGSGHVTSGKTTQDCGRALLLASDCLGIPVLAP